MEVSTLLINLSTELQQSTLISNITACDCDSPTDMWLPNTTDPIGNTRIAIIGAGFAGLRCANVLIQHKCNVTIFEARDRLGGRVAQSEQLGHTVDLGPNWIHGSHESPILKIARETGTELHAWEEEETIFDSDGRLLNDEEAEEYGRSLWDDGLIAEAFKYSERCSDSIDPGRSLYDFFEVKVEGLFTDLPEDVAKRKRRTLLQCSEMWGAYVGSAVQRQSLKFFWLEKTIEGENPFVAGTYARILEAVARPARRSADVRLGCRVAKIITDEGERRSVRTVDGEEEQFDDVVVTVPLGYLKRNYRNMFEPSLPPRLVSAIHSLGYGNLDKVYVTFPSAFWNEPLPRSKAASQVVDSEHKNPNVTATTAPLHPPRGDEEGDATENHFPGFAHFLAPTYAPITNSDGWDQQIMNLAALPPSTAHPTLLFYVHGPCAAHIASLVRDRTSSVTHNNKELIDFFTPYIARLPHYRATDPACTPIAILATAWTNDELAGYGSYSNFQAGLQAGDQDIVVLRQGVGGRGLWFAGEHTAPFDALGTTTGAYLSGERVARRIVERHELSKGRKGGSS